MPNGQNNLWTDSLVDLFKQLHASGRSFGQIAAQLPGVTRNACIGKARRLGLTMKPSDNPAAERIDRRFKPPKPPRVRMYPERVRAKPQPKPIRPPAPTGSVALIDLEPHHCRWPYGDSPPFMFCGAPRRDEDVAWCASHCAIGFQQRYR